MKGINMGKYHQLTNWLYENQTDITLMSFSEIEDILDFKLPDSAYKHRAWWANTISHPQGIAWMEAGFITSDCSALFTKNQVEFSRARDKTR